MLSLQKRQNAHSWFLVVCLVILDDCNLFAASATAESVVLSLGNASLYEQRIAAYNDIALSSSASIANRTTFAQPILAFHGLFPLDEGPLQDLLDEVGGNSSNSDFAIVILVRVSYFTSKTSMATYYDGLILPILQTEHYWYTTEDGVVNDDTMSSENHMILWMSSAWLLQERHQWDLNDATLRQRLVHFLSLKITYGYYEFLSITYTPFSFAALLNLVDFCQDTEIQGMADQAIRRLISDYLLFVNDKGIQFSAAGRDYASRFLSPPYRQMMDGIIYLLTGLGDKPTRIFGFGSFLSTSSIDLSVEVSQWQSSVKTIYRYGHTLDESFEVNSALSKYDRIVFQFSQGMYVLLLALWVCEINGITWIHPVIL